MKRLAVIMAAGIMSLAMAFSSFACRWEKDNVGWWYNHSNGTYTTNNWEYIDNHWYYFNNKGYMVANTWINGYYLGSDGAMLTSTYTPDGYWVDSKGKWDGKPSKYQQNNNHHNNNHHNNHHNSYNDTCDSENKNIYYKTYDLPELLRNNGWFYENTFVYAYAADCAYQLIPGTERDYGDYYQVDCKVRYGLYKTGSMDYQVDYKYVKTMPIRIRKDATYRAYASDLKRAGKTYKVVSDVWAGQLGEIDMKTFSDFKKIVKEYNKYSGWGGETIYFDINGYAIILHGQVAG